MSDSNPDAHRPGEVTGTNSAVATGAPGTLTALVNFGADGLGSFGLKTVANPVDSGLTSKGGHILIVTDANGLHGYVDNGTPGFDAGDREVFTLTVGADGSYQFTLKDQIDHPTLNDTEGDNTENTLSIDLSSYVVATDGDGDSVSLGTGSFTVTVLDDIPVVTARDPGSTTVVTTETITYTLQAGNADVRGMDGQGDHDILLTGVDLNENDNSVNTTGTKIGIGDGQIIDGYEVHPNLSGPEILTMQFVNSLSITGNPNNPTVTHGSAYDVSSASFSIDVAEAHGIEFRRRLRFGDEQRQLRRADIHGGRVSGFGDSRIPGRNPGWVRSGWRAGSFDGAGHWRCRLRCSQCRQLQRLPVQ